MTLLHCFFFIILPPITPWLQLLPFSEPFSEPLLTDTWQSLSLFLNIFFWCWSCPLIVRDGGDDLCTGVHHPPTSPPVASIQNKANSLFHPPGLFYWLLRGKQSDPTFGYNVGTLNSTMMRVFTLWKLANTTNMAFLFFFFVRELVYQVPLKEVHPCS